MNPYVTWLKKKLARPRTFQVRYKLRASCFYKFLLSDRTPDNKIATNVKLTDGSMVLNIHHQGKRTIEKCLNKGSLLWGLKRGGPHVIHYAKIADTLDKFNIAKQWDAIA